MFSILFVQNHKHKPEIYIEIAVCVYSKLNIPDTGKVIFYSQLMTECKQKLFKLVYYISHRRRIVFILAWCVLESSENSSSNTSLDIYYLVAGRIG